jgi:hypothetical protein
MRRILTILSITALALLALTSTALASARPADRNKDGIPDRWEQRYHLSIRVNVAAKDADHDGLSNLGEYLSGTSPRSADTNGNGITDPNEDRDGDGVDNEQEMQLGLNPGSRDSDHDGTPDGSEQAGVIVSFDGGVLTIRKADGTLIVGAVTADTQVECGSQAHGSSEGGGGDGPKPGPAPSGCTSALVAGAFVHEAQLADGMTPPAFKNVHLAEGGD